MFQDIQPRVFHNEYKINTVPIDDDFVIIFSEGKAILKNEREIPTVADVENNFQMKRANLTYLFAINQRQFYLSVAKVVEQPNYHYENIRVFSTLSPEWLGFAGATACQLGLWYETHQYCGFCGHEMEHSQNERALDCPNCGRRIYPKISPAIIVGIINDDKILMTKYLSGYNRYALVSGFNEIGETLEDTVRREIHEEVGLSVHDIQYYDSQPWAFSSSLLVGFFAKLDKAIPITLELDELSEAKWFKREDIPNDDNGLSLTWNMIEAFRDNQVNF